MNVCVCKRILYHKKDAKMGIKTDEKMKATLLVVSALFSMSYYFFYDFIKKKKWTQ